MSLMDMQHQYWVTKQTVLRKLGGKEDECIVASDAELDAKLELFRSIAESCSVLQRVLEQYQERLCVLAQEENSLGYFLKEASKSHDSVGKHMSSSGKALCYQGQQRMQLRDPLMRLHQEVDTFKARAVQDTRSTLGAMERARTEYRADLKWMKAVSAQLDPDTGRGLEKFRKAQNQTRQSKIRFDRLTLDCLEKVDLLAAARCNMFSHALIPYQSSLLTFFSKCSQTLHSALISLNSEPKYDFCVLKELKETPEETEIEEKSDEKEKFADDDQLLFFQDEYTDEVKNETPNNGNIKQSENLINENCFSKQAEDLLGITSDIINTSNETSINFDLLGLLEGKQEDQKLQHDNMTTDFFESLLSTNPGNLMDPPNSASDDLNDDILSRILSNSSNAPNQSSAKSTKHDQNKQKTSSMSNWLKLFSDLDPLSNPDSLMESSECSHRT
ncbi:islet cell autoantigen 1-like protein [Ctenocephalides felis]|uniref:islet cell autoantigen 1-like protein n=1 Tax=Ctenocephalides felis TaxID=7515 RepID=UPI000E6E19A2|nr:islet cell autoantigen 1-like protein [Ctenocephalides felis]